MIPKSLSASSILVSEGCMDRWHAEYYLKTPGPDSEPAGVGTSFHFAAEHFVKAVYLDKTHTWDNIKLLKSLYDVGYVDTFGSSDFNTPAYKDGATLVANWYERFKQGLPNTVISCEVKTNFPVKTSAGEIPWNYIYDRFDQLSENEYEVIDYKTLRAYVRPEDLKQKIQPRSYALAANLAYPNAKRIWVSFDMIRHNDIVGVVFTPEENRETYHYIKKAAERIIAADENNLVPTINAECKWCIKKVTCELLQQSIAGGTINSLSFEEMAQRKFDIDNQMQALKYAQDELDAALVKEAEARDQFDFELDDGLVINITASSRRKISDPRGLAKIVGPELAERYGNFTVTSVDKMLKDEDLPEDVRKGVLRYVQKSWGEPGAKIKKKEFGNG